VLVGPLLHARKLRELPALMFDPEFESRISASWLGSEGGAPDAQLAMHIRDRVERYVTSVPGGQAYVVCTSPVRRNICELLEKFGLRVEVFGFGELPSDVAVRPACIVTDPRAALAAAAG